MTLVEDDNSTGQKDKTGSTIVALSMTRKSVKLDKSSPWNNDKGNGSLEILKDMDPVNGIGKNKDTLGKELGKCTLFASQSEEASESLRYPESLESLSEDSVTPLESASEDSVVRELCKCERRLFFFACLN